MKHSVLYGGDTSFGLEGAHYMEGVLPLLQEADVRILHIEEPFMREESEECGPNRTWKSLEPLRGNLDMTTLCSNHFYDFGENGVKETIEWCKELGIEYSGGGMDTTEAEHLAVYEKDGIKYGLLSWNAIGPTSSFASTTKAGCAYVGFRRGYILEAEKDWRKEHRLEYDVHSIREPQEISGMAQAVNFIDPYSYDHIANVIYEAKQKVDILIVYFHKGFVHQPATMADYERLLCHMAIDNGADVVTASHSHLMRGVEIYKGKAIYHGLNAFMMWTPQLSPMFNGKVVGRDNKEWIEARIKRFGFVPDPEYPTYPFHPQGIYCCAAKLIVEDGRITDNRIIPIVVEKSGVPYPHGNDEKGQEVMEYLRKISAQEDLATVYEWDGDEIVIR